MSTNPLVGLRQWFTQLSEEQQQNLLLFGQKCLGVHNLLSRDNSFQNKRYLSDAESWPTFCLLSRKTSKGGSRNQPTKQNCSSNR